MKKLNRIIVTLRSTFNCFFSSQSNHSAIFLHALPFLDWKWNIYFLLFPLPIQYSRSCSQKDK